MRGPCPWPYPRAYTDTCLLFLLTCPSHTLFLLHVPR